MVDPEAFVLRVLAEAREMLAREGVDVTFLAWVPRQPPPIPPRPAPQWTPFYKCAPLLRHTSGYPDADVTIIRR